MQTDILSLKPHPLNSKIYSNGNTEDLETSIQENGLLDPIVITKDNTIISGHRRWNACKNIGLEGNKYQNVNYSNDMMPPNIHVYRIAY